MFAVSKFSVRSLSLLLVAATAIAGVAFSGAAVVSTRLISHAEQHWDIYKSASAEQVRAVGEVVDALGYGGMIHQFKNFVIRRDEGRALKVRLKAGKALGALERLETLTQEPDQLAAIEDVRRTVGEYLDGLSVAESMAAQGRSAGDIDKAVKVNDGPALKGVEALLSSAHTGHGSAGKSAYIGEAKLALGYGGMIHQFKNFVLRQDEPRIAKVEAGLERARAALDGYEALGVSAEEAAALAQVRGVVGAYEEGLKTAVRMAAEGASSEELDKLVKVDDSPALSAFQALEIVAASDTVRAADELIAELNSAELVNMIIAAATAVLSVVAATAVYVILMRGVARPAARIAEEVRALANGDLSVDVSDLEADTEIGEIAKSAEVFRRNLQENKRLSEERAATEKLEGDRRAKREELQGELSRVVSAALDGDFTARIGKSFGEKDLDASAEQVGRLLESFERGVGEVSRVLSSLSQGELSARMTGFDKGAFGALQNDVNNTMDRLRQMVGDIQRSTAQTARATASIADGAAQMATRSESQAASLEETSATMEEMASTVKSNADNAKEAEKAARDAASSASRGGDVVSNAVDAVARIEESSSKISDIITVIESIAFQTNLLALNAAVEAARAGDAGKGFAVVASEVRTLAQRSSEAAKDITSLINDSSGHVKEGAQLVRSTGDALTEINAAIDNVVSNIDGISAVSREQAAGVEEISSAIHHMDSTTQETSSLVQESAESAKQLAADAEALRELVRFFRTGESEDVADAEWRAAEPAPKAAEPPAPSEAPIETPVEAFIEEAPAMEPYDAAAGSEWSEF